MASSKGKKSTALKEKLDNLRDRLEEIRTSLEAKEADLEELRNQHGAEIAEGAGKRDLEELKSRIRTVAEEVDGLARAAPLLEEAIASTEKDLEQARRDESASEAERLCSEGLAAVEALHEKLAEVIVDEILPLADRAETATRTAWGAEREAARLADQRPPPTSRVIRDGWQQHQGLQQLVEAFRYYLAGGPQAYREKQKIQKMEKRKAKEGAGA